MYRTYNGRRPLLVMTLALLLGAAAGAADLEWREYDDRWEGIRGRETAGGFEFMGIYAEPATRTRGAKKLWVSVPLRRAAKVRVRVWEPLSGYAMVPKREELEPGSAFSWRRARVLEPAGIEAEQLYVKADQDEPRLYFPARLTTAQPTPAVTRYAFRFRSGGGVDLDVTIAREGKNGRLSDVVKDHWKEEVGGVLDYVWDGRGPKDAPQPSGVYHLKLKGTVFLKTDEDKDVDIPFFHDLAAVP